MARQVTVFGGAQQALLAGALALLTGWLVVEQPTMAYVLVACGAAVAGLALPPVGWIWAALVSAVTFRGLATLGLLPSAASYLDLPLTIGALAIALLHARGRTSPILRGLMALAVVMAASTFINQVEPHRGVFYLALLAQPFAVIAALQLAPPNEQWRHRLTLTLGALVAIQVPIMLSQFARYGAGDLVQGTQAGSQAGHHLIGGLAAVGAFWAVAARKSWMVPAALVLMALPFLSAAKQVLFALPAVAILLPAGLRPWQRIGGAVLAAAALFVLIYTPALQTEYAVSAIQSASQGDTPKIDVAKTVLTANTHEPAKFLLGQGPAMTVSHAAYLTLDPVIKNDSPVSTLGLTPSPVAYGYKDVHTEGSFDSPQSSGIGLAGDLGLAGVLVYLALALGVLRAARRTHTPEGVAAAAGFALMLVLGIVVDWLEQPSFTIPVAVLAGLALTNPQRESEPELGPAAEPATA